MRNKTGKAPPGEVWLQPINTQYISTLKETRFCQDPTLKKQA